MVPELNENGRIIEMCRELEHRLERVPGRHLFQKLRTIGLPPHLMTSAQFLFAVRDKCVHRKGFYVDRGWQLFANVEEAHRELAEAIPAAEPKPDTSGDWLGYTSIAGLIGGLVFLFHGASFWPGACCGLLLGGFAALSALQQDC